MIKYEYLEHTADIQFRAYGKTKEEAFANAALAMFNSITDEKIESKIKKTVETSGRDDKSLLYNFLEEALILFDSEHFVVSKIEEIKIKDGKLKATFSGDIAENYTIHSDIKAVTYSEMEVEKRETWEVQVTLDI